MLELIASRLQALQSGILVIGTMAAAAVAAAAIKGFEPAASPAHPSAVSVC